MESKELVQFAADGKNRILRYLERTIGKDFGPKKSRRHAPCHDAVRYLADMDEFREMLADNALNMAAVWRSPSDGVCRIAGIQMQTVSKAEAEVCAADRAAEQFMQDIMSSQHRFPLAIFLHEDPIYSQMQEVNVPSLVDGYNAAGFIKNSHIVVADCFTQELQVPSGSYAVFEGYIQVNEVTPDAAPKFHVTCTTRQLPF